MRSRLTVLVVHLLGAIAFRFVYETESKPFFPGRIPNGDKVLIKKTGEYCFGVGHVSCSGGGALNAFGVDFNAAGQVWTKELCMMDSDGDMYSNGEEVSHLAGGLDAQEMPQQQRVVTAFHDSPMLSLMSSFGAAWRPLLRLDGREWCRPKVFVHSWASWGRR